LPHFHQSAFGLARFRTLARFYFDERYRAMTISQRAAHAMAAGVGGSA